jgi:hypothetical protein
MLLQSHPALSYRLYSESVDMGRPDVGDRDRRLRMANSSPDVKALFNSPSYIYNLEEHEDPETYMPGPVAEYWTPLPPIVGIDLITWMTYH